MNPATHPSVLSSATAGTVIALANTQATVPWWLWTAWAGLTALAIRQAVRDRHVDA